MMIDGTSIDGGSATRDYSVPSNGKAKAARVDLGLELLAARRVPGQKYSNFEIAAWCGCSANAIRLMEQKALKKLRRRLFFQRDRILIDLCHGLFQ